MGRLRDLNELAERRADSIIDDLHKHVFAFDGTRPYFRDQDVLERVKRMQRKYVVRSRTVTTRPPASST